MSRTSFLLSTAFEKSDEIQFVSCKVKIISDRFWSVHAPSSGFNLSPSSNFGDEACKHAAPPPPDNLFVQRTLTDDLCFAKIMP